MPHTPTAKRIAANVRAEMARKSHTQTSLAEALGRTQQSISRRLSGHVPFTIADLEQIATALDVPLSTLIADEDVA